MEDKTNKVELLLESAADYGIASYELLKLKALGKTSDLVSSLIPPVVIIVMLTSFFLFLNIGLAFWLGGILGNFYYGFFVIAAFYGLAGFFIHFFLHNWLRRRMGNFLIKKIFK